MAHVAWMRRFEYGMILHHRKKQTLKSYLISSQVTFIYIALLTIQIVTKQLHNIKIGK